MAVEDLRKNTMMAYLLDAPDHKKDIGHYGQLVNFLGHVYQHLSEYYEHKAEAS